MQDAIDLQDAGCFAVVFEAVPAEVTDLVMPHMEVVVIGIGAGPSTDGQVLVLHDLLKVHTGHVPKFVRQFADVRGEMLRGVEAYADAVRTRQFPAPEHTYSIPPEELERLKTRPPRRRQPTYDW
jgi:3-methyl-2-oxobutanoate hydroxymethyltransferase